MHPKYPHVFSPIKIGPVEIPNRFYFGPHGNQMTAGSKPSRDYLVYLTERVRDHGCGLVATAGTVHERGRGFQSTPYPEDNIASYAAQAEAVHAAGGKIFCEIWYHWAAAGNWQPLSPGAPIMSPSHNQFRRNTRLFSTHAMSKEEIRRMVGAYVQTIRNLSRAGYDGVMVHAAHGALIEQFMSPYFNRRTDEYGGSLENRMRFLNEILEGAREVAGSHFAVGMRFNCDEMLNGGYGAETAREVLSRVAKSGLVDYFDLDVAVEPNQFHLGMPSVFVAPQVYRPYVEAVRSATGGLPVLSVLGRLTTIAEAEEAIASGVCDVAGSARSLIAEPELVKNAYYGLEERSRVCIACNFCLAAFAEGAHGCSINPASFRERLFGVDTLGPATNKSKVVVVGGGPAGLEAARVSAIRGHDVTLFEARQNVGGGLALWAKIPGREFLQNQVDWWERELRRLGVKIQLGTSVTADAVLAEKPDAVVVATGSRYSPTGACGFEQADVPGFDRSFVYRTEDVLLGGARPAGKVVVLDGEGLHAGVGVSEILGRSGAKVEHLTPEIMPVSMRLVEYQEAEFVLQRLADAGVSISTSTHIRRIGEREVIAYNVYTKVEQTIEDVDAVVLCTGREPIDGLAAELDGKVAQLYLIGDASAARLLAASTYEGQKFARYIGEPNAPPTVTDAYFAPNDLDVAVLPAEVMRPA